MARKSLTYFILFLFVFQAGGFVIYFKCVQYSLKIDAKNELITKLPESYFSHFDFKKIAADVSFRWEETNKEFWYKGNIYDIIKTEKSGSLKCLNDDLEKRLFQKLEAQTNALFDKSAKGKVSLKIVNSFFTTIYLATTITSIPNSYNRLARKLFFYNVQKTPSVQINNTFPPPQIS